MQVLALMEVGPFLLFIAFLVRLPISHTVVFLVVSSLALITYGSELCVDCHVIGALRGLCIVSFRWIL